MDTKININQHYQVFLGRKAIGYTHNQMLQCMPELIAKNTPIDKISEETGRTQISILKWIKNYTGHSYQQIQHKAKIESYRELLTKCISENKSVNEIARLINKSTDWTRACLRKLGLYRNREDINKILDEQVPKLIESGYTIEKIAKLLKISQAKIKKWINKYYNNESIVKIRHKNNIKIKKEINETKAKLKNELSEYVAKDMTLTEISKITGHPSSLLSYWLKEFGLNTKHQKKYKLMTEKVPEMIKKGATIQEMSKETGVSAKAISRWINKTYGKKYTNLRLKK